MTIRGYDEFGRKLQIYSYDANLGTFGKVMGERLEVCDMLRRWPLFSEAGKRHQLHIKKKLL